jgi:Lyase
LTIGEFLEFAQDQYFAEGARHRTKNEANGLGFRFTQQQRFRSVLVRGYIKDDFFRTTIALGIYLQPRLSPSVHQLAVIAITYNRKDPSARISATISIEASISSKKCLLYDVLGRVGISAEETREIVGGVELGNDSFVKSGKGIMTAMRKETDSLGVVEVPADKLWGAQTQRSLQHFSIGQDLIPREMITAYATLKKAAAIANRAGKRLDDERYKLIVQTCDEILAGKHHDMLPLHVWMTGSGTQFNMNVNEVISNRCSQLAGTALGSHAPVHPNGHINMAQSSNDSFPSAMCIAAAVNVKQRLIPAVAALRGAIDIKAKAWDDVVKIGRTHMQDATPLTLAQEWSGYVGMLSDNLDRIDAALRACTFWRLVVQRSERASIRRLCIPKTSSELMS